ncbi:MAG: hypothetical protein ABMA13_07970 [Chthoniobacteraceae bacterium]
MKLMRHAHSLRYSALLAILIGSLGLRPASAQIQGDQPGQNYYPHLNSPIDTNGALAFIESQLNQQYLKVKVSGAGTIASPTVWKIQVPSLFVPDSQNMPVQPPVPADDPKNTFQTTADHFILAKDAQLDIALGAAVQKLLDGTAATAPVPFTGSLADLIGALASYKKTTVKTFIKSATINVLNWTGSFPGSVSQTVALEQLTIAAIQPDPAQAAGVVTTMLPLVVPKVKGGLTGTITPTLVTQYGTKQTTRSDSTLTAAGVQSALNALPGISSLGGVRVTPTNMGTTLRIEFGTGFVDNISTNPDVGDFQTALRDPALGLINYGIFTVVPDAAATTLAPFLGDFIITYQPVNLNSAAGTNRDVIPGYADAADEVVRRAIEQSSVNAVAIVSSALGVVMQGVDVSGNNIHDPITNLTLAKAKQLATQVSAAAVNAAFANNAGYLADEIAITIGTKIKAKFYQHKPTDPLNIKRLIASSEEVAAAIFSEGSWTDIKEVALVQAGLSKGFKGSIFEGSGTPEQVSANKPEDNILTQIKTTLGIVASSEQDNYLTNVRGGFVDAYSPLTPTNAAVVAQAVLAGMSGNQNYVAARLTGASAWLPAVLTASYFVGPDKHFFFRDLLQFDHANSGDDTIQEIVEAGVRGFTSQAGTLANSATLWVKIGTPGSAVPTFGPTDHPLGEITKGAALGLKGQPLYNTLLNGVVGRVISGAPLAKVPQTISLSSPGNLPLKSAVKLINFDAAGQAQLKEITSYAISGSLTAGHATAPTGVILTLAKAASGFHQFYQPILQGAIDAAAGGAGAIPSTEQWRAVLAVMAAKKLSTSLEFDGTFDEVITPTHLKATANFQTLYALIPSFATTVAGYDSNNALPITKGGDVINNLQLFPKAIFNKSFDAFVDPLVSASQTATQAVLTGVGLVSPASASLAATIAIKVRPADAAVIQADAIGLNPSQAANIKIAVSTASHVAAGTLDLFDYLDQTIFQNSKFLTEIVTAATVVAPNYAHIIAHAVGFRAPNSVAKVVPALFNYSHITSSDPNVVAPLRLEYDNQVDAAAAMTAAITAGILEARTGYVTGNPAGVATSATFKPLTEVTNLKNAITALVKQSLTLTGNTPVNSPWLPGSNPNLSENLTMGGDSMPGGGEGPNNFKHSIGSVPELAMDGITVIGGFTYSNQTGPGGVITGFVSQAISTSDTRLAPLPGGTDHAVGIVGAVITAAVTVIKADVAKFDYSKIFSIAQAAAQAAKSVASGFNSSGQSDISTAVLNAFASLRILAEFKPDGFTPNPFWVNRVYQNSPTNTKLNPYYQLDQKIANAVSFGVLAAIDNIPGAGAAGVINYNLRSLSGTPVTDIFEL